MDKLRIEGGPVSNHVKVFINDGRLHSCIGVNINARMGRLVQAKLELSPDVDVDIAVAELEVLIPGGKFISETKGCKKGADADHATG